MTALVDNDAAQMNTWQPSASTDKPDTELPYQELAALYEIAAAMAVQVDLTALVTQVLDALQEKLGCASVCAVIYAAGPAPVLAAKAQSPAAEVNVAAQIMEEQALRDAAHMDFDALAATLPQQNVHADGSYYVVMPLGNAGLLALVRASAPFSPTLVRGLRPLLGRFGAACRTWAEADRQWESQRDAVTERNVLRSVIESLPMATFAIDAHGTGISGAASVAHDVTDQKAATDILSAVLNTVGEGILTFDEANKLVMVNHELERIFGYGPGELLDQPVSILLPPVRPTRTDYHNHELSRENLENGSILGRRLTIDAQPRNGATFPAEICINQLVMGGERYFTGSIRDISEQQEYDRLRDEFVSTVSHELRTPLASIMGWTETLLTGHPGPLNEAQTRFLNIVLASSQRLNRLIEEILTVSRIQRGTLRLNPEVIQPQQVLKSVCETFCTIAERQGIQLATEDQWPAGETVLADPQLLEQVMANLLSNALKFSASGTQVSIVSRRVNGFWRVEIKDNGMGIPASDLPRLFQRFVRGSNAKQAHVQGAGLGLYVSKAIIEGHGGTLQLASREGQGTTVWFDVPGRALRASERPGGSE